MIRSVDRTNVFPCIQFRNYAEVGRRMGCSRSSSVAENIRLDGKVEIVKLACQEVVREGR